MSQLSDDSLAALREEGALAMHLANFRPRVAQQRLTVAVAEALEQRDVLLAEAGTGTGKTYAYLTPVLLSGLKTIVSTGTRALQDQLYHRDLPKVRDALAIGIKTALLKGRANYLCRYRLQQAKADQRFGSRAQVSQFQRIIAWSGRTRVGDVAELTELPDDSPLLPHVTSTVENCVGAECPFWEDCFVVKARQRAQSADLVVVNHHLLLADLALKQEGFGEILPGAQAFVIDEAHLLSELASHFFGESFGMRQLQELVRDVLSETPSVPGSLAVLQPAVNTVEHALRELRAAMEGLPLKGTQMRALARPAVQTSFESLTTGLEALREVITPLAASSPGMDTCRLRIETMHQRAVRWWDADGGSALRSDAERIPVSPPSEEEDGADTPVQKAAPDVFWYELSARGFRCQRTPLDVSEPLRTHREKSRAAWIFTSATLAVNGDFSHAARRLGLLDPQTLLEPSPFQWSEQALCYLPVALPEPSAARYTESIITALRPVLEASQGRAFVLCASHRALREAAEALRGGPWPLFIQGEAPKAVLLEQFRASGNGVLLGSVSFREGVDVVGEALSVVVIDKLPFAAPGDPVFEARLEAIRRNGGVPFRDEQLPQAVIALKQGVGRLIRSETDRGVLVLCDPRLTGKSYGSIFLKSLPPIPLTRTLADVERFFESSSNGSD